MLKLLQPFREHLRFYKLGANRINFGIQHLLSASLKLF